MSRVGKKPISVPTGTEIKIEGKKVTVKGPKGELSKGFRPEINVELKDSNLLVSVDPKHKENMTEGEGNKFWGLTRALLANMVKGANEGFEKKLEIQGIGYKASVEGETLTLFMGFTNPVKIKIPETIKITIEKNIINLTGPDKELVGQLAANIRKVRPPEPYKGKGIRYVGEKVRRKLGKKVAVTTQ